MLDAPSAYSETYLKRISIEVDTSLKWSELPVPQYTFSGPKSCKHKTEYDCDTVTVGFRQVSVVAFSTASISVL